MADDKKTAEEQFAANVARLKEIRERDDIKLRRSKYMRETITKSNGQEIPFTLRYYQVQMVLHLLAMSTFIVGDDTGLGKCVTPDTLIETNKGMVPIGMLRPVSDMMPDTFHPVVGWSVRIGSDMVPVKSFYSSGTRPTRRIRTRYGFEIEGSMVHPIKVRGSAGEEWRRVSEIEPGDFVCIERRETSFPAIEPTLRVPVVGAQLAPNTRSYPVPHVMNPDLARLVGYLIGEAWVNHPQMFCVSQCPDRNPDTHADIHRLLQEQFGWERENPGKDTPVWSVFLRKYMEYMGVDYTKSRDKRVPDSIFRSTRESTREFLRGLFEAEASVVEGGVEFSTASRRMAREVQLLLLRMGIVSKCSPKHVKGFEHTYWRLTLFGDDARFFSKKIGFVSSRKQDRLNGVLGMNSNPNHDVIPFARDIVEALRSEIAKRLQEIGLDQERYFYDIVEEVEAGFKEVVDIEVDDPRHCFTGNGFINHNTIETISALTYLWEKDPNRKALVLTKKSAVPQWAKEFARFTVGVRVFVLRGTPGQRKKLYADFIAHEGPSVLIGGYDSVKRDLSHVQSWEGYIAVFDEATVFKNPKTQVHQVCKYLASRALRTWGLTATLIKNNLVEGFGIMKVVVPGLFAHSTDAFIKDYCIIRRQQVKGNRFVNVIVGYRDSDIVRFRDKIEPFYLGRPKHQVADELPVLTIKDVSVGMTEFQSSKYNEALAGLIELGSGVEKETDKLTALIYCQQVVNHPVLLEFEDESSEKLDALVDMLTDGGELEGEKVIVFTRFKRMVDYAVPYLAKKGVKCVRVTGAETEDQRAAAMTMFQDPASDVKVIWITMAGGDAINLQAAKAIVFYDTPWSAGDYLQILGRMIRIGSEHDRVYAIHLIAEDTIDERVQAVLRKKMDLLEAILGQRLKGEAEGSLGENTVFETSSEINDLFAALLADARTRT